MSSDLASTIAAGRRALGLTQAQLAGRAGISASYLSRIEGAAWARGGPCPSDSALRALARALGISSAELVRLKAQARRGEGAGVGGADQPPGWARTGGKAPYAVTVGASEVQGAARRLVDNTPPGATVRLNAVLTLDPLAAKLATEPETVLYRLCALDRRNFAAARSATERLAGGRDPSAVANIRTRFTFVTPLTFDVMIGGHEALVAIPNRAGLVVDDPDWVIALRDWFDEIFWDPPGGHADVRYDNLDECLDEIGSRLGAGS